MAYSNTWVIFPIRTAVFPKFLASHQTKLSQKVHPEIMIWSQCELRACWMKGNRWIQSFYCTSCHGRTRCFTCAKLIIVKNQMEAGKIWSFAAAHKWLGITLVLGVLFCSIYERWGSVDNGAVTGLLKGMCTIYLCTGTWFLMGWK